MYLFRLHIRPQGGTAKVKTTFDYCVSRQILGVGWRVSTPINTTDLAQYLQLAEQEGYNTQVVKYIHRWVTAGCLVWTRCDAGQYFLAKVKSGWRYETIEQPADEIIDFGNIFDVDMVPVPLEQVPGKVIACFRPARTIQEIADPNALEYSKYLWNCLKGCDDYLINHSKINDLYAFLDDCETEDLVFIYLQTQGWYVVPQSRKVDSMSYEFSLIHSKTGEPALIQVKSGHSELNRDEPHYAGVAQKVFLFQSYGKYTGDVYPHIECLDPAVLLAFVQQYHHLLPAAIANKARLAGVLEPRTV